MILTQLIERLESSDSWHKILNHASEKSLVVSGPPGVRPALVASLSAKQPVVVVTATSKEAETIATNLQAFLNESEISYLPAWETFPHEKLSPRVDTVAKRIDIFSKLAQSGSSHPGRKISVRVLVLPIRAALQPVMKGLGEIEPLRLYAGMQISLDQLLTKLEEFHYQRTDMVGSRGEYAVRGGIVDLFIPNQDHPLRLEFFGDELEEMRPFSVSDQRSISLNISEVKVLPCRELLLSPEIRARAATQAQNFPGARELLQAAADGIYLEGIESINALLANDMVNVSSYFPSGSLVLASDPEKIRRRSKDLGDTAKEFLQAAWHNVAAGNNNIPLDLQKSAYISWDTFTAEVKEKGFGYWEISPFRADEDFNSRTVNLDFWEPEHFGGKVENAATQIQKWLSEGYEVIATAPTNGQIQRFASTLNDFEVPARVISDQVTSGHVRGDLSDSRIGDVSNTSDAQKENSNKAKTDAQKIKRSNKNKNYTAKDNSSVHGESVNQQVKNYKTDSEPKLLTGDPVVKLIKSNLTGAFGSDSLKLVILPISIITRRIGAGSSDVQKLPARRKRNVVDPLSLTPGTLVVHDQHGIGKFVRTATRTTGTGKKAITREYIVLEYAPSKRGQPGDQLWIPTDSLDQISRYLGGENPALSKMGGADWQRAKQKARSAVKEIAGELVRLYAARQASVGHAFAPDTPWQRELEDAFPYQETPDQLVTIDEVKADMEKPVPMDRIISGDVGYGKTEIAVRAAFKAIMDGKQVAVLVPTTLLASQHAETFAERYAGFPVKIASLSRFQSRQESEKVIAELASGSVDLVIGTHRLLTGNVRFKNLGIVIIDEEQRFGVEHKETLTQLRMDVDVLAMSATPIPRTLEMAVSGIREMSTLTTPPEDRHPILTYVSSYQEAQVTAAIRREILREGQVFYVHNRVSDIAKVAAKVQEMVPEATVALAHGKMNENQLEQIIQSFWNHEVDVIVCTTIVETGLDISNANTLIVDRADTMGISQIHQLRGRVGRGRQRGYAYFLYPPDKVITQTAHERLQTIATHTELGAGMQVAMKDLEIRGAGNLLGGQQSGHIAGVGFDLYVRMVSEAVRAYKQGRNPDAYSGEKEAEIRFDLPVTAHVPESYVTSERLRIEIYSKISALKSDTDQQLVQEELTDRYGELPAEVEQIFAISQLRRLARDYGIKEVSQQGGYLRFSPVELSATQLLRLRRLYPRAVQKPAVRQILVPIPSPKTAGGIEKITGETLVNEEILAFVREVLNNLFKKPTSTGVSLS